MLTDLGHNAEQAATGKAALEILDRMPDFDAALVDVGLPGMRGDELVAELRRRRPDLPVILTTGYTAATLPFDFRRFGNVVFIGKPYDSAAMERAFARLAAERTAAPTPTRPGERLDPTG
jgi:CheY-like chemotaxis protein